MGLGIYLAYDPKCYCGFYAFEDVYFIAIFVINCVFLVSTKTPYEKN